MPVELHSGCWFTDLTDGNGRKRSSLSAGQVLVNVFVHDMTSRTKVTQTFRNGNQHDIADLVYTFPIINGASVIAFRCAIGDRLIEGIVQDRDQASAQYEETLKAGKSAALLQQYDLAADTFTARLGNVKIGESLTVELEYLLELEYDLDDGGIKITIPQQIAPRYASDQIVPNTRETRLAPLLQAELTKVIVDVDMTEGSEVQGIKTLSSHRPAVGIGKLSQTVDRALRPHLATATLKRNEGAGLTEDISLVVQVRDHDAAAATIEQHSELFGHRAILAGFMPSLPSSTPFSEVVFIIDRSGSMRDNVDQLKKALRLFLQSLPVGIYFNLCGFGSKHSFLWNESREYNESSLKSAIQYVDELTADMGGTEILGPLREAIERRCVERPQDILLLTDGEVWDQQQVFDFISQTTLSQDVRFFSLGIGETVSHSLIQGVAKAGGGFAQTVTLTEQLDRKILRMLKGALTQHITDVTVELVLQPDVPSGMEHDHASAADHAQSRGRKPDDTERADSRTHAVPVLPAIVTGTPPKLELPTNQLVPQRLRGLYPFLRNTFYVMLASDVAAMSPIGLWVRGKAVKDRFECYVPIRASTQGTTIHQLAVKRMLEDLEGGCGRAFLGQSDAGNDSREQMNDKELSRVLRDSAVKLSCAFSVPGKYASFIAVEKRGDGDSATREIASRPTLGKFATFSTGGLATMARAKVAKVSSSVPSQQTAPLATSLSPMGHDSAMAANDPLGGVRNIISMQAFDGSWAWTSELRSRLGEALAETMFQGFLRHHRDFSDDYVATLVAIVYLESKYANERELWDLVVTKARLWLQSQRQEKDSPQKAVEDHIAEVVAGMPDANAL
ncbi:hypothetical protein KEM52_005574 [Ascosphaera acerosa]|nr:hypothetical protein KEM52_005574 [Ascosphaera acerosa]